MVETKCEFPQGLKPNRPNRHNGTAEAMPLQNVTSKRDLWAGGLAGGQPSKFLTEIVPVGCPF